MRKKCWSKSSSALTVNPNGFSAETSVSLEVTLHYVEKKVFMSISRIIQWCFPHDNWEVNKYSVVWHKRLLFITFSEYFWRNTTNGHSYLQFFSVAEKEGYLC